MMLVSQQKRHSSLHFGAVNILTHLHVGSDVFPKLLKSTDSDFSAIFFAIHSNQPPHVAGQVVCGVSPLQLRLHPQDVWKGSCGSAFAIIS